ncbi:hypothetical protein CD798_15630 [Bacillaceae bacterium SAOS 7]|nr:hypothetical protein CD798_15630 [Bacillaceae bacterium SAOS 7]
MKHVKNMWKLALIFLLTVTGLFVSSLHAEAAAKPYSYEFISDSTKVFNQIDGAKTLKITLDKPLTKNVDSSKLSLEHVGDTTKKINIIDTVTGTQGSNEVTVTFKNLEFLDYAASLDYQLVIEKETLRFDQLSDYVLPFKIYDLLPGFKSTFIDTPATDLNKYVLKNNAPRDVFVHIPKMFVQEIQTIHHQTLIDGITQPSLTNIDILTDEEVSRMKVTFRGNADYSRDLSYREDVKGFSMGQAGIEAMPGAELSDEFSLKSYSATGRYLGERKFKLRAAEAAQDGKPSATVMINDYIKAFEKKNFGTTFTLYELMEDKALLTEIMKQIPVEELNSLGVTYSVGGNTATVNNLEELKMVLDNPRFSTIKLGANINEDIEVNRSVTIIGGDNYFQSLKLQGTDTHVRLEDVNIQNDLTVDVGANGTVILDDVSVGGTTTIISGGVHSVHLNNFKSNNGIKLENTTPLRIVSATEAPKITMNGAGAVTLEGVYRDIAVDPQATSLTLKNNTIINGAFTGHLGLTINIPAGYDRSKIEGQGNIVEEVPVPGAKPVIAKVYGEGVSNTVSNWQSLGKNLTFDNINDIPVGLTWSIEDSKVFGGDSTITFDNASKNLRISGVSLSGEPVTKEVVLIAEDTEKVYKIQIAVTVEP